MKKKYIKVIAIVVVIVFIGGGIGIKLKMDASAKKTDVEQQVTQTAVIEKQDLKKVIGLSGTVVSAESKVVSSDLVDTLVSEIDVKVGDVVKEGDVICRLDSTELQKKIETIKKNLAASDKKNTMAQSTAQRNLQEAKKAKEVGDQRADKEINRAYEAYTNAVRAKDSANTIFQEALNQKNKIQDQLNKAKADSESSQEFIKELEEELADAKQNAAEKESSYKTASDSVTTSFAEYEKQLEAKEDTERTNDKTIKDQEDTINQAVLNDETGNLTDKQELEKYQKQLDECEIKATMDGVITSVSVKQGDMFKGGEIAVIQKQNDYRLTVNVDQYDISNITNNMQALIKTDSTGDLEMEGVVDFVSLTPKNATAGTGNTTGGDSGAQSSSGGSEYEVGIKMMNPSEKLRFGMTAKVSLVVDKADNVLTVPYSCVTKDENGGATITVLENGAEKTVTVQLGLETDYYVAVSGSEIKEGMEVVVPAMVSENESQEEISVY